MSEWRESISCSVQFADHILPSLPRFLASLIDSNFSRYHIRQKKLAIQEPDFLVGGKKEPETNGMGLHVVRAW